MDSTFARVHRESEKEKTIQPYIKRTYHDPGELPPVSQAGSISKNESI